MKKLLWAIVLGLIIGCGGGGDDTPAPVPIEAPKIDNVYITDGNFVPKDYFNPGNEYNVRVFATDNDLDMNEMIITLYHDSETPTNTEYMELPSQSDPSMVYYFIKDGIIAEEDIGSWKLEFQVVDAQGNESNVFTKFIEIFEYVGPAPPAVDIVEPNGPVAP